MKFSEKQLSKYKSNLASIKGLKEKLNYLNNEFSHYDEKNYSTDKEGRRFENEDNAIINNWFRREIEQLNKELDRQAMKEAINERKYADEPVGKIKKSTGNSNQNDNDFTQRQVAIAYSFLGKEHMITPNNYLEILKKHTTTKSNKILQKRINKPSELTKLSGNKSTDSRTKEDLAQAKRLLSGMNNIKANKEIDDVIKSFSANYNLKY